MENSQLQTITNQQKQLHDTTIIYCIDSVYIDRTDSMVYVEKTRNRLVTNVIREDSKTQAQERAQTTTQQVDATQLTVVEKKTPVWSNYLLASNILSILIIVLILYIRYRRRL